MSLLSRQTLRTEALRFFTAVSGVAFSVFLIVLLLGFYQGWRVNVGRFVERVNADIWIAREGTTDFLNSASILPAGLEDRLSGVPGVQKVDPLVVRPMNFAIGAKQQPTHLVGYGATSGGAGGPSEIDEGRAVSGPDEVVVDRAFARKAGLSLNQEFRVGTETLRVVGISSGGDFIFSQTSFVDIGTARKLTGMDDVDTFYLVKLQSREEQGLMVGRLQDAIPGAAAFTTRGFSTATRDRVVSNLLPVIGVIVFLAFLVGVAISGLTIYNAIAEKANEFGILKAVGFSNLYLYRLVLEQGLFVAAAGFVLGSLISVGASLAVPALVPQFPVLLRLQDFLVIFLLTALMGGISSLLPVRRIAGIDPVSAFRR